MIDTIEYTDRLAVLECGKCHMSFAVPQSFKKARQRDHETFYCPAGHPRYYPGKSDLETANDALAKEKHLREQAEALAEQRRTRLEAEREGTKRVQRRLAATQGVVTKHKRRISAGKCPCCSTKFSDLKAHMASQHPDWNTTTEIDALLGKEITS